MPELKQMSVEEALNMLTARAKAEGDYFRLRVFRRSTPASMPVSVCTLDAAELAHIASPETWLPKLAGGGPIFTITVYHANDNINALVQHLAFQIPGEALPEINFGALNQPGWAGPKKLIWPDPRDAKQTVSPAQPSYAIPPSVTPFPGATAPQTSVPAGAGSPTGFNSAEWARLEAERNQLAAMRTALEDQRHKMELDAIKREQAAAIAALEAKMIASAQAAPRGPGLAEILTAIVPVAQSILASNNEMRAQMFAAQQESEKQRNAMLVSLLEKKADDTPNVKIMSTIAEAMGTLFKMTTDNMKAMQDAINGPEEPTAMKVVKEVVKGVNSIAAGMSQQPKVKLPAQPQGTPQLAGVNPQQIARPRHAGATAPVMQFQKPATAPVQAPQPLASTVDQLENLIRTRTPVENVVQFFIGTFGDKAMQDALQGASLDPVTLFQQRLGDEWITEHPENGPYVQSLAVTLQERLAAAGMLENAPVGEEDLGGEEEEAEIAPPVADDVEEDVEAASA